MAVMFLAKTETDTGVQQQFRRACVEPELFGDFVRCPVPLRERFEHAHSTGRQQGL